MKEPTRQSKLRSIHEVLERIPDGATIAIGGFLTANKPMALLFKLLSAGKRDFTVVTCHSSLDVDFLLGMGAIKRLMTPYVGFEALASIGPHYRWAVEQGQVELWETDAGILLSMLRAARYGIPFMPVVTGLGTDLPTYNPLLKRVIDPFSGQEVLAAPVLQPDFALLHVPEADEYGNLRHGKLSLADRLMAEAAKTTFVQAERIISNDEIKAHPEKTTVPGLLVEAVVEAPGGSRPLGCLGEYGPDEARLDAYLAAANAHRSGDDRPWQELSAHWLGGGAP